MSVTILLNILIAELLLHHMISQERQIIMRIVATQCGGVALVVVFVKNCGINVI